MSTKNQPTPSTYTLFGKENFKIMIVGLIIMTIGFFLMGGGKSVDTTKFNDSEIYSFRRITLAPALIVGGFIIEIFAIMKRPKASE